MPTNREISEHLRALLREDVPSRPFLCRGSPAGCEVVIVGVNPATTTPFWNFWDETGCNKDAWLKDYLQREGRYKPTRKRTEYIVDILAPEIRTLELNLYPYSSPREAQLPAELRDTRVFEYTLTLAQPKLLFVHGGKPTEELASILECELPLGQYTNVTHNGHTFEVFVGHHLSTGKWTDERVRELAREFKTRVLATG